MTNRHKDSESYLSHLVRVCMGTAPSLCLRPDLTRLEAKNSNQTNEETVHITSFPDAHYPRNLGDESTIILQSISVNSIDMAKHLSQPCHPLDLTDFPLNDLLFKNHHILSKSESCSAFVRYLFYGSWILELISIPSGYHNHELTSPMNLDFTKTFCSVDSTDLLKDNTKLASSIKEENWYAFLNDFKKEKTSPETLSSCYGTSHSTLLFLDDHAPLNTDNVLLFVIALALQSFCRSELFLHLSEQQWSTQAMLSAPWLDYSRVGRNLIMQYFSCFDVDPHVIGSVSLLDAMYNRLLLTSNQQTVTLYLCSQISSFDWIQDLKECILNLPVDVAVYETSTSNSGTWSCVHSNNMFARHVSPPISPSFFSLQVAARLFTATLPTMLLQPATSSYSASFSSIEFSPTCMSPCICQCDDLPNDQEKLYTRTMSNISSSCASSNAAASDKNYGNQDNWEFVCLTPVLRCPLIVFDAVDAQEFISDPNYIWDLHRVVRCSSVISCSSHTKSCVTHHRRGSSLLNLTETMDMSFLLAQILA